MMHLQELPEKVLDNVLFFLPQNDVRNLALVNYHFYKPCQKKLYSRIVIMEDQVLDVCSSNRLNDFMLSQVSFLYGYLLKQGQAFSLVNQRKLLWAKLEALIQSMQINSELVECCRELYFLGDFDDRIISSLNKLVSLIQLEASNRLQIIHASSFHVRTSLDVDYSKLAHISELIIDSVKLPLIPFGNISSIRITGHCKDLDMSLDKKWLLLLKHLSVLVVSPTLFDQFFTELLNLSGDDSTYPHFALLKTFRLVVTESNLALVHRLVPYLQSVSRLEIVFKTADFDALQESLSALIPIEKNLTHLSLIQDTPEFNSHSKIEIFEIEALNFIKALPRLKLFYMRFWIPEDSIYEEDGVDGNYLRRLKFYRDLLPSGLLQKITLILPNLVSSLASYEQAMNTVLWNGCKCQHCLNYLDYVDEYLFTHQYYNDSQNCFKDIVSSHIISTISQYLSQRMILFNNTDTMDGVTHLLKFPLVNRMWNFHTNYIGKGTTPFKCLNQRTFHHAEFEDIHDRITHRKHDHYEGDIFYDAEDTTPQPCFFDEHVFNHNFGICISHYMNDLIKSFLRLHRGDAEYREVHELETTDGVNFQNLKFNKVILNGISYVFNRERNNTAFFVNVYDGDQN